VTTPDRGAVCMFVAIIQPGHSATRRLDVTDSVSEIKFSDDENLAQKLSLTVDNRTLANLDAPMWRKGAVIEARWGYVGDMTPTYEAVIQSVKGFSMLTVEALAKSIIMHKEAKTRKWTNVKRSDVVRLVAKENGYAGAQAIIDDSVVVLSVVYQARETDAQLLQRLARDEGFRFSVDYDGLHWHQRKLAQAPLREYIWRDDPGRGDFIGEPTIENDVTAKPASINVQGLDPLSGEAFDFVADNGGTPRESLAAATELIDPVSGEATFQPAAGQSTIVPSSDLNEAAATRRVQGEFRDAQMTVVKMTMPVVGDPRVRARSVITVKNIRSLSGNYYIAKADDTVSASGFTQSLYVRRDGRSEIYPKSAKPNGKVNDTPFDFQDDNGGAAGGKLDPVETINEQTGEATTAWPDLSGRDSG
jgi:uncharacterized protein